jgi:hypothetical protein
MQETGNKLTANQNDEVSYPNSTGCVKLAQV